MTNLTTEEMQRIVDGANEGSESYGFLPSLNVHLDSGCDVPSGIRNIDDLREILSLRQEVDRLREMSHMTALELEEDELMLVAKYDREKEQQDNE